MRIRVHTSKEGPNQYVVELSDGAATLFTGTASGIKERDALIWRLAQEHSVTDIEIIKPEVKPSEAPSIPVLDQDDLGHFAKSDPSFFMRRILTAVEEGILLNLDTINVFELSGTGTYLTAARSRWKAGVQSVLNYAVREEVYEMAAVARNLLERL